VSQIEGGYILYTKTNHYAEVVLEIKFRIKIEQDEDGWYVATVPALPGCISQGKTEEEAKKNVAEAIELHLSALAEDGVPIGHREGVKEVFVAVHV